MNKTVYNNSVGKERSSTMKASDIIKKIKNAYQSQLESEAKKYWAAQWARLDTITKGLTDKQKKYIEDNYPAYIDWEADHEGYPPVAFCTKNGID